MRIKYQFQFSEDHLLTSLLRYQQQTGWLRPFLPFRWLLGAPISEWFTRRRFRKSPFYNDAIELVLSEQGAHAVGRDSEVRVDWVVYTKARRFQDGLMLFQGPRVFNWLPDAAAEDAAAIAGAKTLARAHVEDYREL